MVVLAHFQLHAKLLAHHHQEFANLLVDLLITANGHLLHAFTKLKIDT